MTALSQLNPERTYLRRKIGQIGLIYAIATAIAAAAGFGLSLLPFGLTAYDCDVTIPTDLWDGLIRPPGATDEEMEAAVRMAARAHPVECFKLYLRPKARLDGSVRERLRAHLDPEILEAEMMLALTNGDRKIKRNVLEILADRRDPATRRLLEYATTDRDAAISRRAREILQGIP